MHSSSAAALRYQDIMGGRDAAIAAALDELIQAAANLPPKTRPSRLERRPSSHAAC
jgi:hypothetical protein